MNSDFSGRGTGRLGLNFYGIEIEQNKGSQGSIAMASF
jgi:hypothetical protein